MNKLILLIPLLLLTPTFVYAHEDYTQSKGCESNNMTAFWLHNVCHHQPPPRLVATTGPGSCINGTCDSGGWIPQK